MQRLYVWKMDHFKKGRSTLIEVIESATNKVVGGWHDFFIQELLCHKIFLRKFRHINCQLKISRVKALFISLPHYIFSYSSSAACLAFFYIDTNIYQMTRFNQLQQAQSQGK